MIEPRSVAAPVPRALRSGARSRRLTVRPRRGRDLARPRGRVAIRLWLPLTPLFVLLAPFALIAAPLIAAAVRPARGVAPLRAALALGGVLLALSGTVINVESRQALVRIRIF